jgi:hypothetical protein
MDGTDQVFTARFYYLTPLLEDINLQTKQRDQSVCFFNQVIAGVEIFLYG